MNTTKRRTPEVNAIMTVQQVAEYLRTHSSTIYRLLKSREIPAFRVGSDWRFRRSDVEQWITDRHSDAGSRQ